MWALVTGASSGIGREIAKELSMRGYNLIITARDEDKLIELKNVLKTEVKIIVADFENEKEVFELYENVKNFLDAQNEELSVLINDAGFGTTGEFWNTDLNTEINMLKVNDRAMHILFKLFLKDMLEAEKRENREESKNNEKNISERYILNVASLGGFMPGPLMSAYYASKAYMLNLTMGVYKELKMEKSKINVSVLCPGPVYTNFADRAGVEFNVKSLTSEYVANYAINKMFNKKLVIVPGFINKCGHLLGKIMPAKLVMAVTYRIQERKFG